MTLVAGLNIGGAPAFVGDLLSSWRLRTEIKIPTQRTSAVIKGAEGNFAKGLAQKISIVRPYLMLAYAGNLSTVHNIITELDGVLPKTMEEIAGQEDLFLSILDRTPNSVEMVAIYFNGHIIQPLCIHTCSFEIEDHRLYILGSGGEAFFNHIVNDPDAIPRINNPNGMTARAFMMRFAASAMMYQWVSGLGLNQSWGGGFEIAYVEEDGFKKVDNILIRAWGLDEKQNVGNIGISFLQHYEGADLHLTEFTDEAVTTIIPSFIPSRAKIPTQQKIRPQWTIDLIHYRPTNAFTCAVQFDGPSSKNHAEFEFEDGNLAGWKMDKSRLDALIERTSSLLKNSKPFTVEPLR